LTSYRESLSALSFGSNIGDRLSFLYAAVALFRSFGCRPALLSRIYETEPVECRPQPPYLNRVLILEAAPGPRELLSLCQRVESVLGRRRRAFHGPRTIDVDLLFSGAVVMSTAELTLPHPALPRRRSILAPLLEVAPDWRHPVAGRSVAELLASCPDHGRVEPFTPSGT